VSSFMASVLCGCEAPLEPGDASGMNLMDISSSSWARDAVRAVAPDLSEKLPPIRPSSSVAGVLAPYWQRRFGCGAAKVVAWTGDNPSSLIGLGLVEPGEIGISLGTSDTVFAPIATPAADPSGAGHVFGSPTGEWMALTCFANGSLARERVRDQFRLDWDEFSALLGANPPGNAGQMMLPWFVPEITPRVEATVPYVLNLDVADAARNVRAVLEGQAMAMRVHSEWFAPSVSRIRATGGAAVNRAILQVIADVFNAEVIRIAPPNAASLGAALRAYHADRLAEGERLTWRDVVAPFTQRSGDAVRPRPDAVNAYVALLPRYRAFLDRTLKENRLR
jgi:xylulokinase